MPCNVPCVHACAPLIFTAMDPGLARDLAGLAGEDVATQFSGLKLDAPAVAALRQLVAAVKTRTDELDIEEAEAERQAIEYREEGGTEAFAAAGPPQSSRMNAHWIAAAQPRGCSNSWRSWGCRQNACPSRPEHHFKPWPQQQASSGYQLPPTRPWPQPGVHFVSRTCGCSAHRYLAHCAGQTSPHQT